MQKLAIVAKYRIKLLPKLYVIDVDIITTQNSSKVIDSSKIRNARSQQSESPQAHSKEDANLELHFDGEKDKTMERKRIRKGE